MTEEVKLRIPEEFIDSLLGRVEDFEGIDNIGVCIAGDWNDWGDVLKKRGCINPEKVDRMEKEGGEYVVSLDLSPGTHYFKPLVSGATPKEDNMFPCYWIDHPGEDKVEYEKDEKHSNWIIVVEATSSKTENEADAQKKREIINFLTNRESEKEIDSIAETAKSRHKHRREKRHNYLAGVFRSQLDALAEVTPKEMIKYFRKQGPRVLSRALDMEIPDGNLPFLLVPSFHYLSLINFFSMLPSEKEKNFKVRPQDLFDEFPVPEDPYIVFNVGVKNNPRAIGAKKVKKQIKKEGCSPSTLREGVALAFQNINQLFSGHSLVCLSSFYLSSFYSTSSSRKTKTIPAIGFLIKKDNFYVVPVRKEAYEQSLNFPYCEFRG